MESFKDPISFSNMILNSLIMLPEQRFRRYIRVHANAIKNTPLRSLEGDGNIFHPKSGCLRVGSIMDSGWE